MLSAAVTLLLSVPLRAQMPDSALEIYAVNVVKTPPFEKPFTGYGIYLGQGLVITAAHVVGHWPFLTRPHVVIAGRDFPTKIIKQGSYGQVDQVDLALLSVDAAQLPISLQLRRNPLCQAPPLVGMEVIDVVPGQTTRLHLISPLLIAAALREKFDTLIESPAGSGSGIFDAERKCLLGIVSAKVEKYRYQPVLRGGMVWQPDGFAGYFVSAAKIANFIPPDLHY